MSKRKGFRIEHIQAILGIGDDDEEGVVGSMSITPVPLISADLERFEQIKAMAQRIADASGRNFKIVRFSVREDIGEIKSKKLS